MLSTPRLALVLAAVSLGCNPTTSGGTTPPPDNANTGAGGPTIGGPPPEGGGAAPADPQNPGGAAGTTDPAAGTNGAGTGVVAGSPNDTRFLAPEISHSKGVAGGVVVLFPRIIPSAIAADNQNYAQAVQQKMKQLVEKALPGRPIDVRPSPERVCPKAGCEAMSIGVLFTRQNNSCIAVALVNAPGVSTTKMVPWGGEVTLKADPIQFRDPPENFVTIKDYTNCDQLVVEMGKQDSFVEAALRAAAGPSPSATATTPAAPSTPAASGNITAKPSGK
jgi:hypothetical protein